MGLFSFIEDGVDVVLTTAEVQASQARNRERAVRECLRLADALTEENPTRAQRLREHASNPQRTADELWGVAKNDDRQPRESSDDSGRERARNP